jgi:flagellar basal body P-ring formation protein FlgA
MRVRSFYRFLLLSALILPGLASAAPSPGTALESIDLMQISIREFIEQTLSEQPDSQMSDTAKIDVRRIDPRLRLSKCDKPLTHSLMQRRNQSGNLTVKTACEGIHSWSIYTSAKVQRIAPILVANRYMNRGDLLSQADVRMEPRDTHSISHGFITDLSRAIGMELKRPLREGEALRLSQLIEPLAVIKGDAVVIEATSGQISVVAPGEALANGRTGQQIKVRNTKSDRIIRAKVISPGKVQVIL